MKKNWKNLPRKLSSFLIIGLFLTPASAFEQIKTYRADEAPLPLKDIKIIERLGQNIDLQLAFQNEENQTVLLKKYFGFGPVLMSIVYYNCPSLCNFHINGLFEGLAKLSSDKKTSYQLVLISMDDTEKPALAKEKKANYLKKFPQLKKDSIHFLTGSSKNIKKLANSFGFPFYYDEPTQQFAHSPVAYTLSPKAMISRYLYGIEFPAKTLKLSLLEANAGKTGNMLERILLFCYRFNPQTKRYTLYAMNVMKLGGGLIILALMLLLIPVWLRERKHQH